LSVFMTGCLLEKIVSPACRNIKKNISQIKALIRFTMKRPYKISQQTLQTDYTEHTINNKNINKTIVKESQKIAN